MAARDHNLTVMRYYVVLVSILAGVCLIGWAWVGWNSSTMQKSLDEMRLRAEKSEGQFRTLNNDLQLVQGMIGVRSFTDAEFQTLKDTSSGSDEVNKMQDLWKRDMAMLGANVPVSERNYNGLVQNLLKELRARNLQMDDARKQQDQLVEENKAVLARETAAAEQERQRADDLAKQLEAARADFTQKIDDLLKTNDDVNKKLNETNIARDTEGRQFRAQITKLKTEVDDLRNRNAVLAEKRTELEGEEFQSAQGVISAVSNDGRYVTINLGRSSLLRTGVRFSVIDPDQVKMSEAKPKARIEVVEVQTNLARCRVLEDSNIDPIKPQDMIYSPAWQPGRSVEFALLGRMDINDDGSDDRELVKNLIRQSGGEIVEELMPDGKKVGDMTINTRWLVQGDISPADQGPEYTRKHQDMINRARGLGVSQMNLDKLMNWSRSNSDDRSIPFGSAVSSIDMKEEKSVPASIGGVSGIYKDIQPQGPLSNN